ncbi:hypothetical protein HYH03_004685 [Edaphochlamys debaryana]|uniref:Ankyrin repeat domain-containing protein n=1 Tax=Edaphochlamys debaryana TaxID=47281 RepID=A0A836C2Y1_9CHLO|nr:hypothetical protein HYH03_004685 [Edaphochlamys debaryana]|eukprot:KAG2497094.1 hypothetical protein HYH03_004685 [Edaphochlamys debaryana]
MPAPWRIPAATVSNHAEIIAFWQDHRAPGVGGLGLQARLETLSKYAMVARRPSVFLRTLGTPEAEGYAGLALHPGSPSLFAIAAACAKHGRGLANMQTMAHRMAPGPRRALLHEAIVARQESAVEALLAVNVRAEWSHYGMALAVAPEVANRIKAGVLKHHRDDPPDGADVRALVARGLPIVANQGDLADVQRVVNMLGGPEALPDGLLKETLRSAASNKRAGWADIVRWVVSGMDPVPLAAAASAGAGATANAIARIRLLSAMGLVSRSDTGLARAVAAGSVDGVRYMRDTAGVGAHVFGPATTAAAELAAGKGHLHALTSLLGRSATDPPGWRATGRSRRRRVLRAVPNVNPDAMLRAALLHGHLDVAEYVVQRYNSKCGWDPKWVAEAAGAPDPAVVRALLAKGLPPTTVAWRYAAEAGSANTLHLLRDAGFRPPAAAIRATAFVKAARNGDLLTLRRMLQMFTLMDAASGKPAITWTQRQQDAAFNQALGTRGDPGHAPLAALQFLHGRVGWRPTWRIAAAASETGAPEDAGTASGGEWAHIVAWIEEMRRSDESDTEEGE